MVRSGKYQRVANEMLSLDVFAAGCQRAAGFAFREPCLTGDQGISMNGGGPEPMLPKGERRNGAGRRSPSVDTESTRVLWPEAGRRVQRWTESGRAGLARIRTQALLMRPMGSA